MNNVNLTKSAEIGLKAATSYTSNSLREPVKLRLGKQGVSAVPAQSVPQYFREICQKFKQLPALAYETPGKGQDGWTMLTYDEYERKVQQAALLLLHVGLQPRSAVGILSHNCPEWFYGELGAMRAGGIVAGIYPTNSAEAVFHVLHTSEAMVCLVDDALQMAKVRTIRSRLPLLHAVLQLHGPYDSFVSTEKGYYRWEDLIKLEFSSKLKEELARREHDVSANECAMLVYTSGTVGKPKAVMLSHDSIIFNAKTAAAKFTEDEVGAETTVTYLPLSHIAPQIYDIFLTMERGGCVWFADRNALKGTLTRTFAKAKPTRIFGVPRVFEKLQEKLSSEEKNASTFTRFLWNKSREIALGCHLDRIGGKPTSIFKYWLATKVTNKIKLSLGLDRCTTLIIGGAPVTDKLKRYFLSLDMPLTIGYGMSETGGGVAMHIEIKDLISLGKVLEGFEVQIFNPDGSDQGEICLRGRSNFMGYLNEEEKTKETINDDGWLHSGDLGYLDNDGNLVISGRIKELIITSGGENISPLRIEELIKRELRGVSNAVLIGEHRKYLTILLTLKTESDVHSGRQLDELRLETIEWLQTLGLSHTRLSQVLNIPEDLSQLDVSNVKVNADPVVLSALEEGIKRANKYAISNAQKVQKFALLPHDFSIPTGELGPTLKTRRNFVYQKYQNIIEELYE